MLITPDGGPARLARRAAPRRPDHRRSLLAAVYDGLRLATVLACLGAATSLASPPGCSRRCRPPCTRSVSRSSWWPPVFRPGDGCGRGRSRPPAGCAADPRQVFGELPDRPCPSSPVLWAVRGLAAAMDSRGYGRTAERSRGERRVTAALVPRRRGRRVPGPVCPAGRLGRLDRRRPDSGPRCVGGRTGHVALRPTQHSHPLPPRPMVVARKWVTAGGGLLAAAAVIAVGVLNPRMLTTSVTPPVWPAVPPFRPTGHPDRRDAGVRHPEPPMPVRSPATVEAVPA